MPERTQPLRVAVIGAGLAGLSAARTLRDQDHEVRVFDKGRGVGGRTSTRRSKSFAFDHGAQYFTAHDERFGRLVASWQEAGIVAPWPARITVLENGACRAGIPRTRYVGVPRRVPKLIRPFTQPRDSKNSAIRQDAHGVERGRRGFLAPALSHSQHRSQNRRIAHR